MKILSLLLAVLLCFTLTACQPADSVDSESSASNTSSETEEVCKPLLYEVSDEDGSRVWLFGSIHVGDESMMPLPSYVMQAFDEADALAVECDVLKAADAEMSSKLLSLMGSSMYADGSTIQDHVDAQVYEDAKALLEAHGLYVSIYDSYSPVVWWLLLQEISIMQSGYDSQYGADMQLLNEAYRVDKTILEIESIEEQYELLFSFSEEIQEMLMRETAAALKHPFSMLGMRALLLAWKSGNEDLLVSMLNEEGGDLSAADTVLYEEYDRMMVGDRNIRMTDFAEDMLESDQEVFICVGAAHVVGDDAMVDLLEERGYTVEIIQ